MPVENFGCQELSYNCSYRFSKDSCTKRVTFEGASTCRMDRASHMIGYCAWNSSPHLLVTLAQLMKSGISQNASSAVGDFA